jgi:hypothetical protein
MVGLPLATMPNLATTVNSVGNSDNRLYPYRRLEQADNSVKARHFSAIRVSLHAEYRENVVIITP